LFIGSYIESQLVKTDEDESFNYSGEKRKKKEAFSLNMLA